VAAAIHELEVAAVEAQDQARFRAVRSRGASAWLSATPISALGLRLSNEAVRIAVGLRLGAPICRPHNCVCGTEVDTRGVHGLHCRYSRRRHSRHSQINEIIHRHLQQAGIPSVREPRGLLRDDDKRPDGTTLIPWSKGRCLVWDATVPDTLAPSHLPRTSVSAGAAALGAEKAKLAKYKVLAATEHVVPVAIETFGVF